jgi:hypothetical protein
LFRRIGRLFIACGGAVAGLLVLPSKASAMLATTGKTANPVTFQGTVGVNNNSVNCNLSGNGVNLNQNVQATGNNWSVNFGNQAKGTYAFTASAPVDGTANDTITV